MPEPLPPPALTRAREQKIAELSTHFANDDLSLEDLERRIERVYKAATIADLEAITADLRSSAALVDPRTDPVSGLVWYPSGEIRVYGVTECINNVDGEPCLVLHTALPDSVRDLVAKAPAADGSAGWTWPGWENIGGAMAVNPDGDHYYYAFVAAAYNAAGHSKFIILDSSTACPDCTY